MSAAELFEQYAAAFARGERPDVRAYLERAGEEREQLARLVDGFLRAAVPPPPHEDAIAALRARLTGEPPLLALRKERAVRVDDVVDALLQSQGWTRAQRAKVKRYYQGLEGGLVDARRVALPVLETIARVLRVRVSDFEGYRAPPPAAPAPVYRRAEVPAAAAYSLQEEPAEPDDVDRAFTAGR